jgi:hypothetical protein
MQRSGTHSVLVTRMQVALATPIDESLAGDLLDTRSRARLRPASARCSSRSRVRPCASPGPSSSPTSAWLEDVAGVVLSIARGRRAPQRAA